MSQSDVPPPPEPDPWARPASSHAWGAAGPPPALAPFAYASFGERAGAALLDGILSFAALMVVFLVATVVGWVLGVVNDTLGGLMGALLAFAGYLGVVVVLILTEAGPYGQTPGKHMVGIRVLDTSAQTLSRGMAVGRYFAKIVSGLPCYVGYLWPLWDAEKRTFHDMIVSTRVVKATDKAPSLVDIVQAPFTGKRAGQAPTTS